MARLRSAGFPVPEGIVLTTVAFAAHVALAAVPADAPQDAMAEDPALAIRSRPLPREVAEKLAAALAYFDGRPLAVRSSAVAEDMPGASFAGQYETVLGVTGQSAVMDAVRTCWASAFSRHLTTYRESRSVAAGRMAVLIQPLLDAVSAGVAFTANPVTGDRGETLVSAVRGLGDRLVSGQASPDEWVVCNGEAVCRAAPEGAIEAGDAIAVARLARDVETAMGQPQDIEWAIAGGKLYLLQARPITAMPDAVTGSGPEAQAAVAHVPLPVDPPPGFWEREAVHFPKPMMPMTRSIWPPLQTSALRYSFAKLGMMLDTLDIREIGGWAYVQMVPVSEEEIGSRLEGCIQAVQSDRPWQLIESWYSEWKPELTGRIAALRQVDLASLDDESLVGHVAAAEQHLGRSAQLHFLIGLAQTLPLAEFFFACRDLLGWPEAQTVELLSGLSNASSAPARALAELAERVRANPALAAHLKSINDKTAALMAETDPDFGAALDRYLWAYGCRTLTYEVNDPAVSERPEWVLGLLRDQLDQQYDPALAPAQLALRRSRVAGEARSALAGRLHDLDRFDRLLARAELLYPLREDCVFHDISPAVAVLRFAILELGRRLAQRGQLDKIDDIFFLEKDEAAAALRDGRNQRELVLRRQGERAWALTHPGPAGYGDPPPPPPPLDDLPPEVRFANEAVMWAMEQEIAVPQPSGRDQDDTVLPGIGASAGSYTGPVRVVLSQEEFGKIRAGDVLVCPITSPVWSVLFPSVGALVTDSGGILSHSAIIAREYRIPAVVSTVNGTSVLRDGQVVTVNGSAGVVRLSG